MKYAREQGLEMETLYLQQKKLNLYLCSCLEFLSCQK